MFRSLLFSAVLLAATPLAAQEFTPQDLVSYAQSEEEALLRERERLLAAEAALAEPLWLRRADGQVDVVDGGPIYDRASFVIEMAVSMRAEAEIDSLEAAAGFEMPAFLRDITQQVAEAVAATDTPDQASIVSRARNRLIEAYRTASQATRRETLVGIDQRLTWVREVFEEAKPAKRAPFPPSTACSPPVMAIFTGTKAITATPTRPSPCPTSARIVPMPSGWSRAGGGASTIPTVWAASNSGSAPRAAFPAGGGMTTTGPMWKVAARTGRGNARGANLTACAAPRARSRSPR